MFSAKVEKVLNQQMRDEFYSSYLYLSMAAYFERNNLKGFAHWMKVQSAEERGHAMKLFDFIHERGGRAFLETLPQPPAEFKSAVDVVEKTLAHEKKVTASIHKLYELAAREKDYATQVMLQWFVSEQVEEEASVTELLATLKRLPDKTGGLLYLDKELKKREG